MTEEETYTIVAKRMAVGEPVAEGYLYGREACEMISRRLVTKDVMDAYRQSAFLTRRQVYGHEAAVEWERRAKETHDHARLVHAESKSNPERTRNSYAPRPASFREQHADA